MIRLVVGAALAAVVLFAWQIVFWDYSGLPYRFLRPLPDEADTAQALRNADLESGTYVIPFPAPDAVRGTDPQRQAAYNRDRVRGPIAEIIYRKQGVDPTDAQRYVAGFCQCLAAALLAGILLILAQPGLRRYLPRVVFVLLVGVFASVAVGLQGPVWFHHPWPAVLYEAGAQAVGWLAAGLLLAAVVRPGKPAPAKTKAAPPLSEASAKEPAQPLMEVALTPTAAPRNP
jgi:hypothetical protein